MLTALMLLAAAGACATDTEVALRGLDPVLLCEGEERPGGEGLEATHGRFTYRFASEDTRRRFLAEPERWGIQWGGGCARMGPMSGVGSPDRWTVHDGRIYIFASDGCRDGFLAAPGRFAVPPVQPPEAAAGAREAGAAWIARALEAHGGAPAVDAAQALRLVYQGERDGWSQRLEQVITHDGRIMRRSTWVPPEPDGETYDSTWVLARDSFVDEGDAVFPLTSPDQKDDLRRYAQREPIALLWARARDGFLAVHKGAGELDGHAVENVQVWSDGLATTLHLDPESGRVRGLSWRGRAGSGVTSDVVETFGAYSRVDRVLLPGQRTVSVDGRVIDSLAVAWQTVELLARAPGEPFRSSTR